MCSHRLPMMVSFSSAVRGDESSNVQVMDRVVLSLVVIVIPPLPAALWAAPGAYELPELKHCNSRHTFMRVVHSLLSALRFRAFLSSCGLGLGPLLQDQIH